VKYRFVDRGREPNKAKMESKMDFGKVLAAGSSSGNAKIDSRELSGKWRFSINTTVLSAAAVITVLVTAVPALLGSEFSLFSFWEDTDSKNQIEEVDAVEEAIEPIRESTFVEEVVENEPTVEEPVKVENPKTQLEEPTETVKNEDILIRARPIPDLQTFLISIDNELVYPKTAIKDSLEGFVRVFFKVNKEGYPEDFKINKSLGEVFDNEAIRVLKLHDQWEPATFNGQAVDSYFTIKVSFEIEKPKSNDTSENN